MTNQSHYKDITGKNRIVSNVIVGWLGQFVFVISGFILPRLIDSNLGKETLGIWDFSWSLITYFEFIYSGLVSSVNRYVARHRANQDLDGINITVNSALLILLIFAGIVAILSSSTALLIPYFMQSQLGSQTTDAQWVVFFLGMSLVVKICLAVFGGVLTGCHRWDLQHGINAGNRVATLIGMIIVLEFNGGLPLLSLSYFSISTIVLCSRISLVFRVCPGLRMNLRLARRSTISNMWRFGLKTLLPDIGDLLSNQTFNILLVWFLGPAALAGYARPRSLIRHIQTFVRRYAFTLTPTASSLQAISAEEELRDIFTNSCRTGAYITFPMIAVLIVMGGPILQLWMGQKYGEDNLSIILAIGYLPFLIQLPLNNILQGLNSHGWPGLFKFIAATAGIILSFISLYFFKTGVEIAAVCVFVPFWISEIIATPIFASRRYYFGLGKYWLRGIFIPLLITVPMIISLLAFRFAITVSPKLMVLAGVPFSMVVYLISIWLLAISDTEKKKVIYTVMRLARLKRA